MSYSKHALDRCLNRIGLALGKRYSDMVLTIAEVAARQCKHDTALMLKAPVFVGQAWTNQSNGDTVIAIVRDKRVITYMFRRSTQPFTPEALHVVRCIDMRAVQEHHGC